MWISNIKPKQTQLATKMLDKVFVDETNFNDIANYLSTITNTFTKIDEEISDIIAYPFIVSVNIVGDLYIGGTKVTGGDIGTDAVRAWKITDNTNYFSLGECEIPRHFNNFADYNGYTKVKVFLPMLGYVDIDTNECIGKFLQFRLCIDWYSGTGMYIIGVSREPIPYTYRPSTTEQIRVIATYECQLGVHIPIGRTSTGELQRNLILGTIKTAAAIGTGIYLNSLPAATTVSSGTIKTTYSKPNPNSRRGGLRAHFGIKDEINKTTVHNKPVDKSKPYSEAINGSIDTLNSLHFGGSTDRISNGNLMGFMTGKVHVIIYRPKFILQEEQFGHLYGFPLGEVHKLEYLSGYTEINSIHFEGAGFETITKAEIAMLEQAFSDGVYL